MSNPNFTAIIACIGQSIVQSDPPSDENGHPRPDWTEVISSLVYASTSAMMCAGMKEVDIVKMVELAMHDLREDRAGRFMELACLTAAIHLKNKAAEPKSTAAPAIPTLIN